MVGGYQIIDFKGLNVTTEQPHRLVDAKIADILRNSNKPIYIKNLVLYGELSMDSWLTKTTNGKYDGNIYSVKIDEQTLTITTNNDIVSIMTD